MTSKDKDALPHEFMQATKVFDEEGNVLLLRRHLLPKNK